MRRSLIKQKAREISRHLRLASPSTRAHARTGGRGVFGRDSFNSLERWARQDFWEVATVLRYFTTGLQAAECGGQLRQL
jgi:hypothetical protein